MGNGVVAQIVLRNPGCWAAHLSKDLGVRIEISAFKALSSSLVRQVATIDWAGKDSPAVLDVLRHYTSVVQLVVCESVLGGLVVVDSRGCIPCHVASKSDSIVSRAIYAGPRGLEWTTISADPRSLQSLLTALRERNCEAEVQAVSASGLKVELTGRQREVLSVAVGLGYFEDPKRTTLQDLAQRFGMSKVAVRELLRKAENKLLRRVL
ncbi:MAG TPA: helix-turn-helix domain-containing protein [Thermoplasmata archaeon]|nr:helix-turn-helix domain-containing protein [Thermoplasmata archaeon]